MSFKTLRVAGTVTAAQTADDAAHEAIIGKLSPASSYRVTEFGGNDVLFLISDDYPTASSTNGFYLKASTSTTVVPDVERALRFASEVPVAIFDDDGTSDPGANGLLLEAGTVDDPGFVLYDRAETEFRISVINETAGSDGAVYVEEVAQGHPGA